MSDTLDLTSLGFTQTIKFLDWDGQVKELSPVQMLTLNKQHLPFETQAIEFYRMLELAEKLSAQAKDTKAVLDQLDSQLYLVYINDENLIKANGNKKPTEGMLNAAIKADQQHVDLQLKYNKIEANYRRVNGIVEAYKQRKDMIQSISAKQRVEMGIGTNTSFENDVESQLQNLTDNLHK